MVEALGADCEHESAELESAKVLDEGGTKMSIEWHGVTPHHVGISCGSSSRGETEDLRQRIEQRLDELIPPADRHPEELHRAMRYSLCAGGKRIRPMMTIRVATDLGASGEAALDTACAIEMVHTASLILDDLPCMDDAELRRGKAANHRLFGEDTSILAATALLNRAFGVVADCEDIDPSVRLGLIRLLSSAVGSDGIIAGQFLDLHTTWRHRADVSGLTQMYAQKTGALFVAAVEAGARIAGVDQAWVRAVREYAHNLGLAFQILDDLLDAHGTPVAIGKDTGQDDEKTTVVSHLGAEAAQHEVRRYMEFAASALEPLGESGVSLMDLARSYTEPTMERVIYP
jgi:geranylgeranyl diphosphate synthase type II